jgi:hypothetical protein
MFRLPLPAFPSLGRTPAPALLLSGMALALALGGCDRGPMAAQGEGRVQILLTDEPADYLEEARVWISRVYLVPGEGAEGEPEAGGPFVDLFHDPEEPLTFNLLELRDGVVADLTGEVEVPSGDYRQLRMVVSDAWVRLAPGYLFRDGTDQRPLHVPSGAQVGIRVNLAEPIRSEGGTLSTILVDLDVNENFVIQGNPHTPAGIQGILFTPVLRELDRTVRRD